MGRASESKTLYPDLFSALPTGKASASCSYHRAFPPSGWTKTSDTVSQYKDSFSCNPSVKYFFITARKTPDTLCHCFIDGFSLLVFSIPGPRQLIYLSAV